MLEEFDKASSFRTSGRQGAFSATQPPRSLRSRNGVRLYFTPAPAGTLPAGTATFIGWIVIATGEADWSA
jgi:hypothetical protein